MRYGFTGSKQVINFANSQSSLSLLDNKKGRTFHLRDICKLWVEVIIVTFVDAVVTIDVLTASNNDVKLTCRNANCTFSQGVLQVTEMIKDFFEFKSFDSGIFLGRKIWQVLFSGLILVGIVSGIQNNLKIHGSAHVS